MGSLFSDPIDVYINADLGTLGAGVIGSTSNVLLPGVLQPDRGGDGLRCIGRAAQWHRGSPPHGRPIQRIRAVNSGFGFDYDKSDGVTGIDFESVALHEIGHSLGFISSVDFIDTLPQPLVVNVFPLDLFRFNIANTPSNAAAFTSTPRELRPGQTSVTSDTSNSWLMSTGVAHGDGRQASHWKDNAFTGILIGALDPNISYGETFSLSSADIRALDLIGWDVQSVPEPGTLVLFSAGFAGLVWKRRHGRRYPQ